MMNKPAGCVSACRDTQHKTVLDFFPAEERVGLFPMGRLDKNSVGILLITDDGKLNRQLLAPENHIEKQYYVWGVGMLTEKKLDMLRNGVSVKGLSKPLKADSIRFLKQSKLCEIPVPIFKNRNYLLEEQPEQMAFCLEIVLTEGKRHEIKRLLEAIDCVAVALKRVSFAGIALDKSLKPGEYRKITEQERNLLLCYAQKPNF
ncbi:MAG: pseudouridine synthase [Clostridia bacterium]|nr:pseudouridine synthase [Clostridia bacterium]